VSKVDALRALREARYAAASRPSAPKAAAAPVAAAKAAAPVKKAPAKKAAAVVEAEPSGELCGHRSMNGRSCTRDSGHAEKNHRYG
jgi:hypothetical protein